MFSNCLASGLCNIWFWTEYFCQRWKRIYISWMIVRNYTSHIKSDFYEIVNVINNFLGQLLSVKVTSGMTWATKSIDCFNQTTINATIPSCNFPSLSTPTYSPDWCRFLQIQFIYHQNTIARKRAFLMKCF